MFGRNYSVVGIVKLGGSAKLELAPDLAVSAFSVGMSAEGVALGCGLVGGGVTLGGVAGTLVGGMLAPGWASGVVRAFAASTPCGRLTDDWLVWRTRLIRALAA